MQTTGPISVASFMRQCLTSDLGGYYTSHTPSPTDQFGTKGDFVTSPEISQVFGELIGVWIVAEWIAQGRKASGVQLMETGPGRGTLMSDVLRTIRNFPELVKATETVYLVEASRNLRMAQHKLLCGENEMKKCDVGYESKSKNLPAVKIIWAEDVRFIPRDAEKTPFILAHEFFDALPIHVFQSVPSTPPSQEASNTMQTPTGPISAPDSRKQPQGNQWRELVVSLVPPHRLKPGGPEFELSLSKAVTPHSMYLPETSPRYRALHSTDGATIEISPESQAYARDFAVRLGGSNPPPAVAKEAQPSLPKNSTEPPFRKSKPSGAALIIDYGPPNTIPTNSLRGIKSHKLLSSPFVSAGATDLSADVDFMALAETAINSSPGVEVHGPIDQAAFLTAMGIEERAAQLVKRAMQGGGGDAKGKEELTEVAKRIEGGVRRLVDRGPQGMGGLYKVMAIVPYAPVKPGESRRRPVGFGGDVKM